MHGGVAQHGDSKHEHWNELKRGAAVETGSELLERVEGIWILYSSICYCTGVIAAERVSA